MFQQAPDTGPCNTSCDGVPETVMKGVTAALQEVYTLKARELEAGGRLRDAEKLYCSIKAYDSAIAMYKQHSMWEHVMRLVAQHCKVCHSHT